VLVEPFQNSDLVEPPPNFIGDNFEKSVISVSDFFKQSGTSVDRERDFQKVLLHGLSDTKVGMYSNYHGLAVYKYGYSHQTSVRYAYM
jgi:RNA-dependent RNA polymerase